MPFGHFAFGEWKWSKQVFFDSIPELYRLEDANHNQLLEKFTDGLRPSFDLAKEKIRRFFQLREAYGVQTEFDEQFYLKLGKQILQSGEIEQSGINGTVDATFQFADSAARFTLDDVGKILSTSRSIFSQNNRDVTIATVIDLTHVLTSPSLSIDTGPLTWTMKTPVEQPDDRVCFEARSGDLGRVAPGWELEDGKGKFTVLSRGRFFDSGLPFSPVKRSGTDLEIISFGPTPLETIVRSATGAFAASETAIPLVVRGSPLIENNGVFRIKRRINATDLELEGVMTVSDPESGSLTWELLESPTFGQLVLSGLSVPLGIVEQEGNDLTLVAIVTGTHTRVSSNRASFTSTDVGKNLTIIGSTVSGNNVRATVTSVESQSTIVILGVLTLADPDSGSLKWELRTPTLLSGEVVRDSIHAPAFIDDLGADFGITVDQQDAEIRQRRSVYNVSRWIDKKGVARCYEILAAIKGFSIVTTQLFRISQEIFNSLPVPRRYEIGEGGPGQEGTNGSLTIVASRVRLTSSTALFTPGDVGRHIRITGAATGGNNKLYTIEVFVSTTTVEFRVVDTATTPDANNGTLGWKLVRLYGDVAPLIPVFDEVNADQMEELIDGVPPQATDFFGLDKYCWEADWTSVISVTVITVTPLSPGVFTIRAEDVAQGPDVILGGASVIVGPVGNWSGLGRWKLKDSTGKIFFIDTVPVLTVVGPPDRYDFNVQASVTPSTGAATIEYVCPMQLSCDYCASNRILGAIEEGLPAHVTIA